MLPVASLSQCLHPTASCASCCVPPPPLNQTPLSVTMNEGNKPGKRLKNTSQSFYSNGQQHHLQGGTAT